MRASLRRSLGKKKDSKESLEEFPKPMVFIPDLLPQTDPRRSNVVEAQESFKQKLQLRTNSIARSSYEDDDGSTVVGDLIGPADAYARIEARESGAFSEFSGVSQATYSAWQREHSSIIRNTIVVEEESEVGAPRAVRIVDGGGVKRASMDQTEIDYAVFCIKGDLKTILDQPNRSKGWTPILHRVCALNTARMFRISRMGLRDIPTLVRALSTSIGEAKQAHLAMDEVNLEEVSAILTSLEDTIENPMTMVPDPSLSVENDRLGVPGPPTAPPNSSSSGRLSKPVPKFEMRRESLDPRQQMEFLRAQLALSIDNLDAIRVGRRTSSEQSADQRLEEIFKMAREKREKLAEEAPEYFAPVHVSPDDTLALHRKTPSHLGPGVGVGVGALEDFLDNKKDIVKLQRWIERELHRAEFERLNEPMPDPRKSVSLRNTLSMLSLYKGLSRSVSREFGDEDDVDSRRGSHLQNDPDEIWHRQIEDQITALGELLEGCEGDEAVVQEFQNQIFALQEELMSAELDVAVWMHLSQRIAEIEADMKIKGLMESSGHLSPQSSKFHLCSPPSSSTALERGSPPPMTQSTADMIALLNALKDSSPADQPRIVAAILATTQHSATNRKEFCSLDPLPHLIRTLRSSHLPSLVTLVTICLTEPDTLESFIDHFDGANLAVDFLRDHHSNPLLVAALFRLIVACSSNTAARKALRTRPDLKLFVTSMEEHADTKDVQLAGCLCVGTLTACDRHLRINLGDHMAATALYSALAKFLGDTDVVWHALLGLINLSSREQICLDLAKDHADECVLQAMERYSGISEIVSSALWVLSHIGTSDAGLSNLAPQRLFRACALCMGEHKTSIEVQRSGCWLLSIMAREPAVLEELGPDIAELVVAAMEMGGSDAELRNFGDACLLEVMRQGLCTLSDGLQTRIQSILNTKRNGRR